MKTRASRLARLCAAVVAVAATTAGPATPALADQSLTPTLLQSNWYWHKIASDAPAVVADPGEPSDVPAGDLPVASRDNAGTPSKESVVAFDLSSVPAGSAVSSFVVTLTVDGGATNVKTENPKLVAGLALRNWANGAGGTSDTVNAPPVEETAVVPGVFSADSKTVVFAISGIAQAWIDDSNYGILVRNATSYKTPFQLSFLGGKDVKATMAYTPGLTPPTSPPVNNPGTGVTDPGTGVTAPGTGVAPPPSSFGTGTGTGTGFNSNPGVTNVPPPTTVTSDPVAAPGGSQPAPFRRLAEVSGRPEATLFWAGLGLLALLIVFSIILGGEPTSAVATRPTRLSTVLRSRSHVLTSRPVSI